MEMYRLLAFGSYQKSDIASTLKQRDHKDATDLVVIRGDGNTETKVRRITPLEYERLQGYPDGWTDIGEWIDSKGKRHKDADSPRYKALGNSIAIPPWMWVLERLSSVCGEDKTMASLFDGIGGFPLIWERINGPGTCVWGSEIDEFARAVTRQRFPDKEREKE